jgi:hypothetical protein
LTALAFSGPCGSAPFCPADSTRASDRQIHTALRLRKRDRTLELGRGEQVVDHFDQAIVEVLRRMSKAFVRFLE